MLRRFASLSQALTVALYAKTIGLGEDPANGSCPSVGGTETVRNPREESRYGAAVPAGFSVGVIAFGAALSVEVGIFPE